MPEVRAYIGVGSNIDPERHIPAGLRALQNAFGALDISPAYRSPPLGFKGADFINCVAGIDCDLGIAALIGTLKTLESNAGRQSQTTAGSRELDLDLLLYGKQVIHSEEIILPRPDVLEYAFVLRPLAELAPTFTHPVTGHTLAWHWDNFTGEAVALAPIALNGLESTR
ncbi:MAG: 2-amino-4-hydroxy-6-hydroxymethyldihydropteridine diphosphokinase [Gammaproteobacteria bacterium]